MRENLENMVPGAGHISDSEGLNNVAEGAKEAKKRGRRVGKVIEPKIVSPELAAAYDELYKGKNWEEIGALYFNIRLAMTGDQIFKLDRDQKETLGSSLAVVMKSLMVIDPKYVALAVFGINLSTIVAEKEIIHAIRSNTERKADSKLSEKNP